MSNKGKRNVKKDNYEKAQDVPYVLGLRAVAEVLKNRPSRARELLLDKPHKELQSLASQAGVSHRVVEPRVFEKFSDQVNHQGVALMVAPRESTSLHDLIEKLAGSQSAVLLAVDEIYDPQNFGAILRAAECFGVDAVLWSKNRGVSITPTVTKVSAGASELVPLVSVSNLRQALQELKEAEFWICVTSLSGNSQSIYSFDYPGRVVFVLGSEGKGVQPLIQKEADFVLEIPMLGCIDSLNVSQSAAVILSSFRAKAALNGNGR